MNNRKLYIYFFHLLIIISIIGCIKLPDNRALTLDKAHKKFIRICEEDFNLKPIVTPIGNTLWIYLPMDGRILDLKASKKIPIDNPKEAVSKPAIKFLDSTFDPESKAFNIDYDISISKSYIRDFGYSTAYSEKYQNIQRNLMVALNNSYYEVGKSEDDEDVKDSSEEDSLTSEETIEEEPNEFFDMKKTAGGLSMKITTINDPYADEDFSNRKTITGEKPPEFIVIVIADITNGIGIEGIVYFEDLARIMSVHPSLSHDEYIKRYVTDIRGNESLIDDIKGKSLKIRRIELPEFLAKQLINRVKFKYTHSSFAPGENANNEILKEVAHMVAAYNFRDFSAINLNNLDSGNKKEVPSEELVDYIKDELPEGGKLHVIKFF